MYVFGRFGIIRSTVAWAYKQKLSKTVAARSTSLVNDLDPSQAARTISKDGYFTGLRLRPDVLEALQRYSQTETCFGEEGFQFPFYLEDRVEAEQRYGRKLKVGRFDDQFLDSGMIRVEPFAQVLALDAQGAWNVAKLEEIGFLERAVDHACVRRHEEWTRAKGLIELRAKAGIRAKRRIEEELRLRALQSRHPVPRTKGRT